MRFINAARAITALALGLATPVSASDGIFYSAIENCPEACASKGSPSEWTVYHSLGDLGWCNKTMLLSMNIYNSFADHPGHTPFHACTADTTRPRRDVPAGLHCSSANATQAVVQKAWSGGAGSSNRADVLSAITQVQSFLSDGKNCNATLAMGYSNGAVVGVYAGPGMQNSGAASTVVQQLRDHTQSGDILEQQLIQVCGDGRNADNVLGIIADATGHGLAAVQNILGSWSDGTCATGFNASSSGNSTVWQSPPDRVLRTGFKLQGRSSSQGTCRAIQVVSGDSCGALASRCGISGNDFTKNNPSSNLCSDLQPGQWVCCSPGPLPDMTPKKNADGSCATHTIQDGDTCSKIFLTYHINHKDINGFNKDTWGWMGCKFLTTTWRPSEACRKVSANISPGELLFAHSVICISAGTPPMPSPVSNAICGPQVPGSNPPGKNEKIGWLNPCPLNACCNIWLTEQGQCGTTNDFCTDRPGPQGAPGTAPKGENGCISNCGTDIKSGPVSGSPMRVGYFEAWNFDRPCLNMPVQEITSLKSGYTHVHFAFATITNDFSIDVGPVVDQFNQFVSATGFQRIVSFGGWSFSTSQDSYPIFRQGVTAANRLKFAQNLVNFLAKYNLDGVDFDWEYPGVSSFNFAFHKSHTLTGSAGP
ncbi:Uncharacterized protein TCAP_01844 [Tolypocladium capitatum]|uniref:Uncharacterized protein n=1 Tax=Tolypocladium capitatum TaxID=45235 RepID=A0A2K3QL46_9HYPO|nr:Uncharacterized protein TCAP_01844 [Tolypocladium capitatum]